MTDQDSRNRIGLLLLAGVGAGALTGIVIGLLAARPAQGTTADAISETADDLKRRAEQILRELSDTRRPSDTARH